jgi:peptidoglycan/LPS O-acetylase OafA/YrhL
MSRFASQRFGWMLCLVLGVSLPWFKQIEWAWLNRLTHVVAKYSYGIYLTHIIAIVTAVHVLAAQAMAVRVAVFFAILVGAPVVLYHAIEEPMIRLGSKLARRIERGPEPPVDELTLSTEVAP